MSVFSFLKHSGVLLSAKLSARQDPSQNLALLRAGSSLICAYLNIFENTELFIFLSLEQLIFWFGLPAICGVFTWHLQGFLDGQGRQYQGWRRACHVPGCPWHRHWTDCTLLLRWDKCCAHTGSAGRQAERRIHVGKSGALDEKDATWYVCCVTDTSGRSVPIPFVNYL